MLVPSSAGIRLPSTALHRNQAQPSTLNPQPSTLNPQPSTLNHQPSTLTRKQADLTIETAAFAGPVAAGPIYRSNPIIIRVLARHIFLVIFVAKTIKMHFGFWLVEK